jgi:hypothetical protein
MPDVAQGQRVGLSPASGAAQAVPPHQGRGRGYRVCQGMEMLPPLVSSLGAEKTMAGGMGFELTNKEPWPERWFGGTRRSGLSLDPAFPLPDLLLIVTGIIRTVGAIGPIGAVTVLIGLAVAAEAIAAV